MLTASSSTASILTMSTYSLVAAALLTLPLLAACSAAERPARAPADARARTRAPTAAELDAVDATHDGVTLNPYHAIVRGKVLRAFRGLTAHDPAPALATMANDVHYTFEGEGHALAGTRVTRAARSSRSTRCSASTRTTRTARGNPRGTTGRPGAGSSA